MNNKLFGMIKLSENVYVSIFSFFALVFFVSGQGMVYSGTFLLCILLHELSHILFLHIYKAEITRVSFYPFGIDICADTSRISYKKELICTLAGSISNLLFAAAGCVFLKVFPSPPLLFFMLCNLFLGSINLIPLSFFDGGRAIRLILYDCLDIDRAFYLQRLIDVFSSLIFLSFSFFIMESSGFNLSVVCVIIYAAISTLALYIKIPCRKS